MYARWLLLAWAFTLPAFAQQAETPAAGMGMESPPPEGGMLRLRDLTPFGLLRLDMRPPRAHGEWRGDWAFELDLAYQNTFATSINVRNYLSARNAGRRPLDPADVAAIYALPGDAYLIDGEFGRYELIVHRRLDDRWSASLALPYLSYSGGALDSFIEDFHDVFSLRQQARDFVARDSFQVVYEFGGLQYAQLGRTVDGGFGDPVLSVAWHGPRAWRGWYATAEAAAKLAVDGRREWLSTGRNDYGLQLATGRGFGRQAVHVAASIVHYSGERGTPAARDRLVPTLIAAWSRQLGDRTRLIAQGYASESVVDETDVGALAARKFLLSLGLRHDAKRLAWTAAITNNVGSHHNAPDFGLQLNLLYRPRGQRD